MHLPLRLLLAHFILLCISNKALSQNISVSAIIKDETGMPVIGASVINKRTNKGSVTNQKGRFEIHGQLDDSISISAIHFHTKEIVLEAIIADTIIVLNKLNEAMDEVVVIGYGTAKKSDLTGSVAQVNLKNTTQNAYGNILQAMAGKVPGVVVSENSGQPGAGLSIEIRGTGSINFSTQPLYVIDGVPLDNPNVAALNNNNLAVGAAASNPLSAINPNDIASMEVLKDASATAIYGSRGANGVVLITTKTGQAGKAKFSANYSAGFSEMLKYLDMLDKNDYAILVNEAWKYRNPNGTLVPYNNADLARLSSYNHQKDITRNAQTHDVNVSLSGGTAASRYYVSGQYFNQQGVLPSTNLNRINFKLNFESATNTRFKIKTGVNITRAIANGSVVNSFSGGVLPNALTWAPSVPFINPDGGYNPIRNFYWGADSSIQSATWGRVYYNARFGSTAALSQIQPTLINPMAYFDGRTRGVTNANTSLQILGNIDLTYKLSKNIKLNGLIGVGTYNSLLESYIPTTIPVNNFRGIATLGNLQSLKMLYQASINYDKNIDRHYLNAIAVATAEKYTEKTQNSSAQSFTTDATGIDNIAAGQLPQPPANNFSAYQLVSTIFRAAYHYDYRYYITSSARYDGSSKFAENNRFGFFPSAGISWRIINEKWFKGHTINSIISDLKYRASYGMTGNQALGSYATLSTLSSTNVVLGGSINAGYSPSRMPNEKLTWERTVQFNTGIDLGLLKNRINIIADYYQKRTNNLLFNINLPGTSGFASYTKNVASINNNGIEIAISATPVKTNSFVWDVGFNIAFNKNKVISLSGNAADFLGINQIIGGAYLSRLQPAQPIGQFYGYITLPAWNDSTIKLKPAAFQPGAKEGDRRYKDVNGDGLLTDLDRTYLGSAMPKYTGGFHSYFTYKNLELGLTFSYAYGNKIFNQLAWSFTNLNGFSNVFQSAFNDRYIPINISMSTEEAARQKAHNYQTKTSAAGALFDNREVTDYFIEDGSFIRCKDVNLSYNLPSQLAQRLHISNIKAYVNLQNMFTLTRYSGYNPEMLTNSIATRGLDNGNYPLFKTVRFGLNVIF